MANNKVVLSNGTVLMDLTSDTVTADKLLKGYTAHDCHGNKITGTASTGSGGIDTSDGTLVAEKVVQGYVGYSKGSKITGTLNYRSMSAGADHMIKDSSSRIAMDYTPTSDLLLGNKSAKITLTRSLTDFGDATASNVAKGKTFTSAAGLKVTGTLDTSGMSSGEGLPDVIVAGDTPIFVRYFNETTSSSSADSHTLGNNNRFTPPKDGTYRFTVIGWSAGTSGTKAGVSLSTSSNKVYTTGLTGTTGVTGIPLPYSNADSFATSIDVTTSGVNKIWFFANSGSGPYSSIANRGKIYAIIVSIAWDNGTSPK